MKVSAGNGGAGRRVLIIVQNLPVPFDRRVWQEASELTAAGYQVSIICPIGKGYDKRAEVIDGINVYRHPLPIEAKGALGYLIEYSFSLFWEFVLSLKVLSKHGFDVIQACNPPDNIFIIGLFFKLLFGKKFLFDHHDINPELYEAKFGRKDLFYRLIVAWEKLTFMSADVSIATNESYRQIAIERGGMVPEDVFVVRSGPNLDRIKIVDPLPELKRGRQFLVGYVGVMGPQEGIDYLLESIRLIVFEDKRTDIQFILVGSGPSLAELKELAKAKGVEDYVTFTGRVPDLELFQALNTSDVCVNPDEVNPMNDKSTMNKIMEYMALGKPIVQFDVKEGRFSAREASLYAAANDSRDFATKILDLLADPVKREKMGKFGRQRVESELAWSHEGPKLLAAYDRVFATAEAKRQSLHQV
jgi:glycosyltransferase involved in cell wall biosynthesis